MIGPLTLPNEAATAQLAQDIAMIAESGWTIRLEGDLGVGKTSFARAFIRSLADDLDYEVPSPTYTLVQRYDDLSPNVLHADLYRLADPSEAIELGLDDETDRAVRLVEWPDQAGERAFPDALRVELTLQDSASRTVSISGPSEILDRVAHSLSVRVFLDDAGHPGAQRRRLLGDASTRRYERLPEQSSILMDAPKQPDGPVVRDGKPYSQLVHLAESVHAFVAVGTALTDRGFAAPAIHAADLDAGLLVISDLGRAGILDESGLPNAERYQAAAALLAELHAEAWTPDLPIAGDQSHRLHRYNSDVFLTEIGLCPDWYVAHRGVDAEDFERSAFEAAWAAVLAPLDDEPATLTLRDYHSPNIIWRGRETGRARIGIIDHQDALLGPPAYDLASLVYDARVSVPPILQEQMINAYLRAADVKPAWLRSRVAIMAAQRCTKILGIFARLNARDGKPHYLQHLPRVETYMRQVLRHPALEALRPFYDQLLPEGAY